MTVQDEKKTNWRVEIRIINYSLRIHEDVKEKN
jgi:hypothetical protein